MNTLSLLWSKILGIISMINFPTDILDILIVAFLIYKILGFTKSKTSGQIVKAVAVMLVLTYLSDLLKLNTLNFIIGKALEVGLIALVVVFQPELRRLLERLGSSNIRSLLAPKVETGNIDQMIEHIVSACRSMSRQKIGALIVFERKNSLEEYFKTGTVVDAAISEELLKNIFFPKAALHDGAVVIRDQRVAAAGCVLPLTSNPNLSRDLGTRHRAAIGITEHSDAVVVVVSEETGVISVVVRGDLRRYLTPDSLTKLLKRELKEENDASVQNAFQRILDKLNRSRDDNGTEEE